MYSHTRASLTGPTIQVAVLLWGVTLCHTSQAGGEHHIFPRHFHSNHSLKESVHYQIVLVIVSVDCLGLVWKTLKLLQSNLICVIHTGFVVV